MVGFVGCVLLLFFYSHSISRWCRGGKPDFREYHLSDGRSAAGAWRWGDHGVLWRPAPQLLLPGGCRFNCSSDLCTSRAVALYLHACRSSMSAASYCRLCLCGPGNLFGPLHHGTEGEIQTVKEKVWSYAAMINKICADAPHVVGALFFPL